LIEFFEDSHIELYDLSKDPKEKKNIAQENPQLSKQLLKRLQD
jgi:hypothetical protein